MIYFVLLSRFSCVNLQSDDQGAGHLGGLLHVEELRLLSSGRPDATRGETGELFMSNKRLGLILVSLISLVGDD